MKVVQTRETYIKMYLGLEALEYTHYYSIHSEQRKKLILERPLDWLYFFSSSILSNENP